MEEESFPRGGVTLKQAVKQEPSTGQKKSTRPPKEKTLFKESEVAETKKKGKKKKDAKNRKFEKKIKTIEGTVSGQGDHSQPEVLSKNLYPSMLVYCYVEAIDNYSIKMALPNGIIGTVPITEVSPAYTEMIQMFANKSETEQEKEGESMTTLSDLFKEGDLLPCKVTDCETNKKHPKLSLNPTDVNESLTAASIRNGILVYGSISSQEDHGYTVDLGVKGVHAFLPNTEAEEYIKLRSNGSQLKVGQCLLCGVKMKGANKGSDNQSRAITVSVDPEYLKNLQVDGSAAIPFSSLIPGMKVKVTVNKVVDVGLTVDFHNISGSIHTSHLPKASTNYSSGEELKATILYIHPMSKAVVLSCQPYIVNYCGVPGNQFPDINRGMLFPEAKVKKINKKAGKKGVYLKITDKITGFANLFNLADNVDKDNWEKDFHKGTTHRCRVIGFYPMEGLVNVTLKKSELEKKYMTIADITTGSLIECNVKKFSKNGLSVTISKNIVGYIPNVHLADVTLSHPEKHFKESDKLKCRVLSISSDSKLVFLTHKKSLVTTKFPVVTSMNQLEPGMVVEGYISKIKPFGVFVKFFEEVEGFVPKNQLSSEPIEFPEKVFYYGQVVRCKVVTVAPEEGKLKLTFMLEGRPAFGSTEADTPDDYAVGNLVSCKVTKKHEKGLDVVLLPSKKRAFLPKQHLSDSLEMCKSLMKFYKEKDVIDEVMYFNKSHIVLVTRKHSLICATKEETLVTDVNRLELGMMLPGWVRNTVPYGVFLEFPSKLCGLVPRRYTMDRLIPEKTEVYKYGQTVVAKVVEVDKEKKRFLASLRMLDCYHGETEIAINIMESYLEERHQLHNMLTETELEDMAVGQIHHGTVTTMNDLGAICNLDNGVKAIALKDHLEGVKVREGSEFDCVILHIDVINNCVEVTLDPQLITAVRKRTDKYKNDSSNQAQVSQEIKCKVVLIKDDFILVGLKGHASGQLAYLPSKKHYNDLYWEKEQFEIGQENPAIIKRIDRHGNILASLKIHEDKMKKEEESVISHIATHSLKIGDIKTAIVRKIHPDQMYVSIDGTQGKVHATEVHDEIENGSLPFKSIKVKSEVRVRIIGFRETKSWKALPISHPNLKRSCPECSMRPSVLAMKNFPTDYDFSTNSLEVGDKVVVYPYNFSGEILWTHVRPFVQGKASVLNLTEKEHFFKNPAAQFKPGHGYNATVIKVEDNKMVTSYNSTVELSFLEDVAKVTEGEVTKGLISTVRPDVGLVLKLADNVRGSAGLTDLTDDYVDFPTSEYEVGHIVKCCVLKYDKDEKRADVSLRQSRLEDSETTDNPDVRSMEELSEGQIIKGFVVKHTGNGVQVRLGHFISGFVEKNEITEKGWVTSTDTLFQLGKLVTVKVSSINVKDKQVKLSMLEKDTGVKLDIDIPANLISSQRERKDSGSRSSEKKSKRKRSISGSSAEHAEPTESKHPKTSSQESTTGSKTLKKHLKKAEMSDEESDSHAIESESSDADLDEKIAEKPKKRKSDKANDKAKKLKKKKTSDETSEELTKIKKKKTVDSDSGGIRDKSENSNEDDVSDQEDIKISNPSSMRHLDLSEGFSWSSDFQLPVATIGQGEISSEESEDEEVQKPVKKSREEHRREKQEEEKRLFEYERRQLEGEISPETADDFDRLVLQSPDSSLIWLRYMAFHLETSEIDKAKAVAERALKTISFREEQEKLNVWVAYLNLENMYGSKESLQKVLSRAVQQNDATSVYLQMINIYCKSEKTEEAEHLYNTLVKKDSLNKDIWVKFGQFYFQNNRVESARKLLQRCLKTIENKHHVDTIAKFAQMEFKSGEPERGKTMFENILSTYPKRTDLWSVYIDMVTKHREYDVARSLYQRVTGLKLSARKMKFFFKKYLEFEEQHGTETLVAEVKQKALDYVEKQGYVDD